MKKIIALLILSCVAWSLSAVAAPEKKQHSDANIYGHVVEKSTGEHLSYISVSLKGTTIGGMTDGSGHFFFKNLPEGKFTVVVRAVGYKTIEREVALSRGKTQELNFELAPEQISLDEVVVSANRNETTRREAPSLVNVLDPKVFEQTNSACLAEGLNFQPGVRVENDCQNCGFQQVRINGLDGHYSQILMDSRPIFSALTGVYGLEQIPTNMIDRVEVVRGGGSALFGSSAIGGTINIITKEPTHNSAQLSHALTSLGGTSDLDNNTMLNASLVTENNRAGVFLFGQNRNRSGYDHDGDGFTELPDLRSLTAGFRAFLKTSLYSKLTAEYHGINEYRRGGDMLDRPPHEADIAEQTEHDIHGGGLSFDQYTSDYKNRFNVYVSAQNTARKSYYGVAKDPNAYGRTNDLTLVAGVQYAHNWDRLWFMPAELTAGAEYNYDALKDDVDGYDRHVDQKVHIGSVYLQNEWKTKMWSFLIGGRLDKHSMIRNLIFSPRANVRFNPTPDINLRASYSSGFRAPQAFDEDLHIAAVGGTVEIIQIAPDLKEERSHSASLSADFYQTFGSVQTNFLLEGFYTDLSDVFVLEMMGENEAGYAIKERRNGSGARVYGVNFEGKAAFTTWLQLQLGVTWQQSRYKQWEQWSDDPDVKQTKRMFRTPDLYGYFTCTANPWKPFSISLSGTYTGRMDVPHMAGSGTPVDEIVRTPDFFDMNLRLAYDFSIGHDFGLQVNAGVQNIFNAYQRDFDQGKDRDSGYIYGPSLPRSYFVGCKINFR